MKYKNRDRKQNRVGSKKLKALKQHRLKADHSGLTGFVNKRIRANPTIKYMN